MTRIFFWLKRAFQSTLRVTRRWMARLRMTPARLDILKAIASCRDGVWQANLRGLLGVTPQTISRMLKALESRGMVRREHDPARDWRRLWVSLTRYGRTVLRRAQKVLVNMGALPLVVDCALVDPKRVPDSDERLTARVQGEDFLYRIRRALHDQASLYDGWRANE